MMKKIPTISIGIPAYNEEANIGNLLESILSQKQDSFVLKEMIVISDGSTDRTVQEAKKVSDERVKVIEGIERRGQAYRQNEICSRASADFLVLLNADILIKNNSLFIKIMKANQNRKNVQKSLQEITVAEEFGRRCLLLSLYQKTRARLCPLQRGTSLLSLTTNTQRPCAPKCPFLAFIKSIITLFQ